MKNHFASKTLIALAVAIVAAAGYKIQVHAQPIPPPSAASALPAGVAAGTPVAEVLKLAQAGMDASVIKSYITSCPSAFNLDADTIITLTDAGVSSDLVNAMIEHDKNLSAATPPPVASPAPTDSANSAPPSTEVTVNDFDNTLTPYGQWIDVDGYGRCWRPPVVIYDSTWQPYCDRGHWVYTDYGWYWDSAYAWGITFHYGRWYHHDRFGWIWWPDTVWAPSWVAWRSCDDYCGWAPLPPFTVYQPGVGFFYQGASVTVGFDFGLSASCYTFVSMDHFCELQPRRFCVPPVQITAIFNRTTIINNYGANNRTMVNRGISVAAIGAATHHPIQPVQVGSLPNASRHGWAGAGVNSGTRNFGASPTTTSTTGGGAVHREPTSTGGEFNNNFPGNSSGHRSPVAEPAPPSSHSGNLEIPEHSQPNQNQTPQTPGKHLDQRQSGYNGHLFNNNQALNSPAPAASRAGSDWPSSAAVQGQTKEFNSAPAINPWLAGDRQQHVEIRPTYQPSVSHNVMPSDPAAPAIATGQAPANNARFPNWPGQNH